MKVMMNGMILVMFLLHVSVNGVKFDPSHSDKCSLVDDKECLATAIQYSFEKYGKLGIPRIRLPSIDPLKIPAIEIGAGSSAVNLVQKYNDVTVLGLSRNKIETAELDLNKKTLTFTAVHPEIRQEARYNISGKILVIPVYGAGPSVIQLEEATFVHSLSFKEVMKKGEKHFHVENYDLDITIKGAHYDFENLFNGDKKLADNILTVINENWNVIFDDVRHGVATSYAAVFKSVANRVFDSIPVEHIFLK